MDKAKQYMDDFLKKEKEICTFKKCIDNGEYLCALPNSDICPHVGDLYLNLSYAQVVVEKFYKCNLE